MRPMLSVLRSARVRVLAGALAAALLAVLAPPAAAHGGEELTLRVNDAVGLPGGVVAIVLRTYSSRGIGQGQICLTAPVKGSVRRGPEALDGSGEPFAALIGANVFSTEMDARHRTMFDDGGVQQIEMKFGSLTASINEVDGPLAVIYMRLAESVQPGEEYILDLELADTFLIDENGDPIPVEVRAGELDIRAPAERFEGEATAEDTVPGDVAFMGFETKEVLRLTGGRVGFIYDPDIASGPAEVFIDPRYGNAKWRAEEPQPGTVIVTFFSRDRTLNRLPGEIVSLRVPTRADIPIGTQSFLRLDRALTALVDAQGNVLNLELEDEEFEFEDD